jgi:hypothetical protein
LHARDDDEVDDKLEKSLSKITDAVKKQIISLHSSHHSGKILLTLVVELDLSQGFIGSAAITNNIKERIF